jgi:hypothetical protein
MGNAINEIQSAIRHAMMHDYFEDFTTRFEFDSSVREKKSPLLAIDEIRNAFDHFANAQIAATIFDGEPTDLKLPPDPLPILTDPRHLLDVWRGARHLAGATYFSRHFAAACMAEEIIEIMNTDPAQQSPDFQKFLERFTAAEHAFAQIKGLSDTRYNLLDPLHKAIDDTWNLVFDLDAVVFTLDQLYHDIRASGINGVSL